MQKLSYDIFNISIAFIIYTKGTFLEIMSANFSLQVQHAVKAQ